MAREGAGILLLAKPTGRALFLLSPDGLWVLPGGGRERGERSLDAAMRELTEETGYEGPVAMERFTPFAGVYILRSGKFVLPDGPPSDWKYRYAMFEGWVSSEFEPELSHEHWNFTWAPPEFPPDPIHPGVKLGIRRWLEES